MTPATPETYVAEVNQSASDGYTLTPVIGWKEENKLPLPVTLHGIHMLPRGTAVLFPGGMIHNPTDLLAFDTVEDWLETNPAVSKSNGTSPVMKAPTVSQVSTDAPAAKAAKSKAAKATSAYDVEFVDKPYKSNSFWHYDDGNDEFVFVVEGGEAIPKATKKVVKIKRDDFMAMKKTVGARTVADIMSAEPIEVEEEEDNDQDGYDPEIEDLI